MDVKLMIQSTPNPNALKFVVNKTVKTQGNVTYKSREDAQSNHLAEVIFEIGPHIKEVYFFDNYITVTQDGQIEWDDLEEKIKTAILTNIDAHNPDFVVHEVKKTAAVSVAATPEINQINAILDQSVRPALQMDGGDLEVVEYQNNVLKIFYQGACGSCPSSTMGTMKAIENLLRDQFNPDIVVELADMVI